jgi:putative component of toxin-antitoxin plasmid stabilization module
MKIVTDVVNELTIPKEVESAKKYVDECERDMGFMGSREYYKQKKVVIILNLSLRKKRRQRKGTLFRT